MESHTDFGFSSSAKAVDIAIQMASSKETKRL
jgi:hypothetical protein